MNKPWCYQFLCKNLTRASNYIIFQTNLELVVYWPEQDVVSSWELEMDSSLEEEIKSVSAVIFSFSASSLFDKDTTSLIFVAFCTFLAFLELGFRVYVLFLSFFLSGWFLKIACTVKSACIFQETRQHLTSKRKRNQTHLNQILSWMKSYYVCNVSKRRTFSRRSFFGRHVGQSLWFASFETF